MKSEQFWNVDNVKTFRGFDVNNGEVDLSDSEYGDYLDEMYEPVEVAGMTFNVSRIIQELDPVAWRCGMGDYESELQSELESQLNREDSDDIDFIDGDESEL
jgi:hypothetical protein